MDASSFKKVVRLLGADGSRRGMLRSALTGVAASAAAGVGLASRPAERAAAKKKRCKPKPPGTACASNKDCCCQANQICSTACTDIPGEDLSVCCGGKSASCASNSDCCFNFVCNPQTNQCQEGVC
jgi:hypothetical protein